MNASAHIATGAASSALIVFLANHTAGIKTDPGDLILGALLGGFTGLLPDIIEPAINPNHRAICHSILALSAAIYATWKLHGASELTAEQKKMLGALSCGFISHLGMDALTPKGLPLIV